MTFRLFFPPAALLLVLAGAAGAQTPAHDLDPSRKVNQIQAAAPPTEQAQAVAALIDALRVHDILVADAKAYQAETPAMADFDARFLAELTPDEVRRWASGAYLALFTVSQARALTATLGSPAGGRAVQYLHDVSVRGANRVAAPDAAVRNILRELGRTDAGRHLISSGAAIKAANATILNGWRAEYCMRLLKPTLSAFVAARRARMQNGGKEEPVLFVPPPTGIVFVDTLSGIMGTTALRTAHANWQLTKDFDDLGVDGFLTATSLADVARLPQRRAALERAEQRIELYRNSIDANLADSSAALARVDMPYKTLFVEGMQQGYERQMALSVRFAENQRALIDVIRRMLAFVESRQGKFSVRDGALAFAAEPDMLAYNALVREVQSESAVTPQLQAESADRLNKAAEHFKP